jgi:cell division protein FtsZ
MAAEPAAPRFSARRGGPDPEQVQRLRAAVLRGEQGTATPAPPRVEQSRRSGITSLLGRMTGGTGDVAPQPVQPAEPPETRDEEERVEIPAFLRRQAN